MNPYGYQPPTTDLFDSLKHLFFVAGGVLVAFIITITIGLVAWRSFSPDTYQRHFVPFARQARWYLWTTFSWPRIARACGLSISRQVTHKNMQGYLTTSTKWVDPQVISFAALDYLLRLTVSVRKGQTVEDLQEAVPAIRDSVHAHSARSTVVSPGTVCMEFVLANRLSEPHIASMPTAANSQDVQLGRREDGGPWMFRVAGKQSLIAGRSGSGKGSFFQGIAGGLGPAVRKGTVELLAIDLKYGIEVAMGAELFTEIATTESTALSLLKSVEGIMDARGRRMASNARSHTATTAEPLIVVLIDELGTLTGYMRDASLKKQVANSLSVILSKGRAVGVAVVAFTQDPRKEIVPMRGLFTQTVALRMQSRDEVAMVLGDGLADEAPAHRINPRQPGVGYVVDEDGSVLRVRADYWPDSLICEVAAKYQAAVK